MHSRVITEYYSMSIDQSDKHIVVQYLRYSTTDSINNVAVVT